MTELIIITLALIYAYCKAWADSGAPLGIDLWHEWDTSSYWGFGAAGVVCGAKFGVWQGFLMLGLAWLFTQAFFEGFRSQFAKGYWYGEWSRSLPIPFGAKMPEYWIWWLSDHICPVAYGQFRIEGTWAPIWDAARLLLAAGIWWWAR